MLRANFLGQQVPADCAPFVSRELHGGSRRPCSTRSGRGGGRPTALWRRCGSLPQSTVAVVRRSTMPTQPMTIWTVRVCATVSVARRNVRTCSMQVATCSMQVATASRLWRQRVRRMLSEMASSRRGADRSFGPRRGSAIRSHPCSSDRRRELVSLLLLALITRTSYRSSLGSSSRPQATGLPMGIPPPARS